MRSVDFKERTQVIAENQPEYNRVYALMFNDKEGTTVMKMKCSLRERIQILFTGTVWYSVMKFGNPMHPFLLSPFRKEHYEIRKPEKKK